MYIPSAFAERNPETLNALIDDYGFATLVSSGPAGLTASHLPMLFDGDRGPHGTLVGHLARANPHASALDGAEAMAVFHGPHGYISPTWYEDHPAVPTWNYAAIHAYGKARLVTGEAALRSIVARLIAKYEAGRMPAWSMEGLPPDYTRNMLKAIVGIEVEVSRLEGKLKLSQNRRAGDRRRVIAALGASTFADDRELAAYMERHAAPGATP
jgi:transcriptional regulator